MLSLNVPLPSNFTETQLIRVNMSQMKDAKPNHKLTTTIGSCIALAIFDKDKPIGSMVHIVLPNNPRKTKVEGDMVYKYAETAIPAMISYLCTKGARKSKLVAKYAGGANMFPNIKTHIENLKIGKRNIECTQETLRKEGIPVIGKDVGGTCGRRVEFDIGTKKMKTANINGGVKIL